MIQENDVTGGYPDRDRDALVGAMNKMRRELVREMWYPGDKRKTDIGTITACVDGIHQFFDDAICRIRDVSDA